MSKIQEIGLVVKENNSAVIALVKELKAWCLSNHCNLNFEEQSAVLLGEDKQKSLSLTQLGAIAQALVVLGGDGTLLGVARVTAPSAPYLIGVNFGTLGFLTEITPQETIATLEKLISDSARTVSRSLLHVQCKRANAVVFTSEAVNDAVVQKSTSSRLMDLNVFVDDHKLMSIRSDGLIFATPAGSTAYSLAAGGSIVHPQLDLMLITPICAHALTHRPIILPGTSKISVYLPNYEGKALLTTDGQSSFNLERGDEILIEPSKYRIKLVKSDSHDYFSRLRSKLNWGIPNKGG